MFLRYTSRKKDGKEHRYWSIVENKRLDDRRVVQRHVLYLGEINSTQELAWRKSIGKGVKSRDDYLHWLAHLLSCLLWLVHFELNTRALTTMS